MAIIITFDLKTCIPVTTTFMGHHFSKQYIATIHICILWYKSICIKFIIVKWFHFTFLHSFRNDRFCKFLLLTSTMIFTTLITVRFEVSTCKQSTIKRRFIDHYRILLIKSSICHDGYNCIYTTRHFLRISIFRQFCSDQWHLWIMQDMRHSINALIVISHINTKRLFPHGTIRYRKTISSNKAVILALYGNI